MNKIISTLAVVSAFGLAGCPYVYDHSKPLNPSFGNAIHHNSAVAIIDPVPANVTDGAPAMSGERSAIMIERHATGTEEKVTAPDTGSSSSGSGN